MPHYVMVFCSRKPGLTPLEFESGFEGLMSTIAKHTATSFPVSHTRHYIKRSEDGVAKVAVGTPDDFKFDSVYVIEFQKEEDVAKFREERHNSPFLKIFDEENAPLLPDRSSMRAVELSNVYVTKAAAIQQ